MLSSQRLWPRSCNCRVGFMGCSWGTPLASVSDLRSRQASARRWLLGFWIVPALVASHDVCGSRWSPAASLIFVCRLDIVEHRVDYPPRRFDAVVAREQRGVAAQRIAQQALIRQFSAARLMASDQLHRLAAHFL